MMKFCEQCGMIVNEVKTNLLVINGNKKDREDFVCKEVTVKHATSYIYLGSPFSEDGRLCTILDMHVKTRVPDLNKFKIFCKVNTTMSYKLKSCKLPLLQAFYIVVRVGLLNSLR